MVEDDENGEGEFRFAFGILYDLNRFAFLHNFSEFFDFLNDDANGAGNEGLADGDDSDDDSDDDSISDFDSISDSISNSNTSFAVELDTDIGLDGCSETIIGDELG